MYEDFKEGWFGIKHTSKSFSRGPTDLTLEQTINADAASQRMGIAYPRFSKYDKELLPQLILQAETFPGQCSLPFVQHFGYMWYYELFATLNYHHI